MSGPPAVTASAEELTLAQSANSDFAVDLYEQLAKERPGENLFFSPFSISSALLIASQSQRFSDAVDRESLIDGAGRSIRRIDLRSANFMIVWKEQLDDLADALSCLGANAYRLEALLHLFKFEAPLGPADGHHLRAAF